jgi:hypothetical protein
MPGRRTVSLASGITGRVRGFEGAILSLSSSMQCQSSICICKCVLSSVVDVVGVVSLLSVIEYGGRRAINSHRASWSRQIAEPRFPANPCKSLPTRLRGTTHLLTDYTQVIIFGNHPQVSHIFQSSNSRNHGFTLDGENQCDKPKRTPNPFSNPTYDASASYFYKYLLSNINLQIKVLHHKSFLGF